MRARIARIILDNRSLEKLPRSVVVIRAMTGERLRQSFIVPRTSLCRLAPDGRRELDERGGKLAAAGMAYFAAMSDVKPVTRLYCPGELEPGRSCTLPPPQAHHALRVLRLARGEPVILFNGDGAEYAAVVVAASRDRFALDVTGRERVDREAPCVVTLAQAVSSGERMDYTIQKAVELGVAGIQPLETRRSVVRLSAERAERRGVHWQAVAIAACEQCGRNRVPRVLPLAQLDAFLAGCGARGEGERRVLLSPRSARGLRDLERPAGAIVMLSGPEGGLSPEEERAAEQAGFLPVRLGPRVLRTETAAVAALAAMQALWGDF
jgi:16S rRNA (uracil1498-N3)-methyltransferase